jgi:hypothetical protein
VYIYACVVTYIRKVLDILGIVLVVGSDCISGFGSYQAEIRIPRLPTGFIVPVMCDEGRSEDTGSR